ncbi:putative ABC transport system permease protein [Breznakia sp. PF5-3]|uniref:ABC transporter permease n=1 Tax=unclassified Breznakia TaxID=2623764 RepID=UPI002405CB1F|nr:MULTISPECIES: ABC transporter permease [unclassified Breznakia]MDL2276930.1 ABC transporter permease [Breznakia sp. OttesenSCG-928-G09]MDF9824641.1 putative ABC transport system permease protein [Breznakia sp. PM6-1]MDF9835626.1 putative ABC transport system permease protein [Breznakia sp. PF5-3]MDF9837709.1 putative ABC transport system permease protein [Breznakia sp. PFB2-8]MDF9859573.1 putative ABC transport system permease protein [Breznakia sp. PH5-24]
MTSLFLSIQDAVSQGVLWGVMALGVYITFRILDVADLTVDGSFATGGAVCAIMITNGVSPIISLLLAIVAGFVAGLITGVLITKFEIPAILAGILTQIGLYSINMRIMGERSNLPLLQNETLFKNISDFTGLSIAHSTLLIGAVFVALVILVLYWFFGTEIGSSIRATGNNEKMVSALGVNINTTKILGLMISNGLIALSGALVTQSQGYADVKMGTGAIVIGLASIVIGEVLFGRKQNFGIRLLSIVIGSAIYRIIIAIVLELGLNTDDLKLLTAVLVGVALVIPVLLNRQKQVRMYKKLTGKESENA